MKCINCNNEFEQKHKKHRFCRYECNEEYKIKNKKVFERTKSGISKCKKCNNLIYFQGKYNRYGKYCSSECKNGIKLYGLSICKNCGNKFEKLTYNNVYCENCCT